MNDKLLEGPTLRLTGLRKGDCGTIADWHNNIGYLRLQNSMPALPKTEEAVDEWMSEVERSSEEIVFAIRLLKDDGIIGTIGFSEIEWTNQVAEIGIGIGDPSNWRKGYGYEAVQIALNFGYNEMNFHRIQLTVLSYNAGAIALYKKCHFKHEGVFREFGLRDGKRYDMYLMSLLKHEWENTK